ncbi:uncharacterized protein BXZ73DRAFT_82120 [Epithele typhae]|uniref:uncharacterized protein n=1 Tax=Epithele typhae TaxID=378194 RepID=UPI002008929B|nr:uncharacterized protein BXZ73DRAFT_82120 [Epithele typhae]KAH9912857.1 hypothetical protein BXZ73DRAFT_82120 [Epithele typhae]
MFPIASTARMELPFEFGFDIESILNSFNITTEQGVVGGLNTAASASLTQGTISITIENTRLRWWTNITWCSRRSMLGQFVSLGAPTSRSRSMKVESLLATFESLNIDAMIPALSSKLLNFASLQVLSTTGENNVSHTTVSLANPFTAALEITHISSNVTFQGISLGTIDDAVYGCAARGE